MSTLAIPVRPPARRVLADVLPGDQLRDLVLVLAGAFLTALSAQIVIPMTPVPMTAQTLAVGLVGATLGLRRGVSSIALYVMVGFVLPVYASGASGVSHLWGATGGYLVGFVLAAGVIGWMAERRADRRLLTAVGAFIMAQTVIFVPGVIVLHVNLGGSWGAAIHAGFTVFILGGLVKAAVGGMALPTLWRLVHTAGSR